jgi:hypothetical protein
MTHAGSNDATSPGPNDADDAGESGEGGQGRTESVADTATDRSQEDEPANLDSTVETGGPGYADPALLAGRPFTTYLHVVALLAAAGADLGTFYQVASRAIRAPSEWLTWVVVVGFSAIVIYLGHVVGVAVRNRRAGVQTTSQGLPWICLLVLAAMGAVSFTLRLKFAGTATETPTFSALPDAQEQVDTSQGVAPDQLWPALVFLALYVGTVSVAAVGAYLTHNPLRENYVAASRSLRKWTERAAAASETYLIAKARLEARRMGDKAAKKILAEAIEERRALAARLKERVLLKHAAMMQDAAVTDAWFKPDNRSYAGRANGTRNGASSEEASS